MQTKSKPAAFDNSNNRQTALPSVLGNCLNLSVLLCYALALTPSAWTLLLRLLLLISNLWYRIHGGDSFTQKGELPVGGSVFFVQPLTLLVRKCTTLYPWKRVAACYCPQPLLLQSEWHGSLTSQWHSAGRLCSRVWAVQPLANRTYPTKQSGIVLQWGVTHEAENNSIIQPRSLI